MKYIITGASGHLGSHIFNELIKLVPSSQVTAAVHTLSKAKDIADTGAKIVGIDFLQEKSLIEDFSNQDLLIYVPSKSHDSISRVTELENVLTAAKKSNVGHILAMGFIADQANNPFDLSAFYGYLPRRLASSKIPYTIVRNALYADPLVPYLPELVQRQNVIYPMKDQALSFISLRDSSKAFAKVAFDESLLKNGRIYTLTQDRNYTMTELAQVLSTVSGVKIGYQPVSLEEFAQIYNEGNEGHMLSSMYDAGQKGLLNEISDDFKLIMGHDAQKLTEFLQNSVK
ncbi:SDR family oxidoreductase [Companilactobacillus alimentarius]|uniref:NAD(P)-dependent oxidoreductase n=1 Tax=Companilactobacillus alimentarius DSM 20249 TaxID=1423720 RepID=A0A2K9HET2_9LACO|nr:NAD(P)H-binding protein [Companilactobacillus alimentarius]AUI70878.1 NAD(P)-dependent oxidoreductase [Companilactobacillus alimentarius DSM 20249]KRK74985.1 oxidoreductase [Companilactobacillus alimentarius DSM 20249]MDT6951931.1 NAD(P)H-binding protein [Companilactobacillus alimentarius]GEO44245.1 NAD(P)-dependent oxidoreductase [Companilactobacillus alimentarius]